MFFNPDEEWRNRFNYPGAQLVEFIKVAIQLVDKLSNK